MLLFIVIYAVLKEIITSKAAQSEQTPRTPHLKHKTSVPSTLSSSYFKSNTESWSEISRFEYNSADYLLFNDVGN